MAAPIRENDGDPELNHEINVTPFIDVILVLLIIFMVAAPLATSNIPVQLPSSATPARPQSDKPVYVTLQQDRSLYVEEKPVTLDALGANVDLLTERNFETRIFVRADKNIDYGMLMKLLNELRKAGYLKIGLVGVEHMTVAD